MFLCWFHVPVHAEGSSELEGSTWPHSGCLRMDIDYGWGVFILFYVASHPPVSQSDFLKWWYQSINPGGQGQNFQDTFKPKLWKFYNVTSATFCWPKRVTGPVQIQRSGKTDLSWMRRMAKLQCKGICILVWEKFVAIKQFTIVRIYWMGACLIFLGCEHGCGHWSLLLDPGSVLVLSSDIRLIKWDFPNDCLFSDLPFS